MFTALTTDDLRQRQRQSQSGENSQAPAEPQRPEVNNGPPEVNVNVVEMAQPPPPPPVPLINPRPVVDPRPLEFRTPEPGYWTLILLPLAIYFADQPFLEQTLPAVAIIAYNSLLLFALHSRYRSMGVESMSELMEYLKGFNLIFALLTIGYAFSIQNKDDNLNTVYEYTLWAGLNFSFPYVFKSLVVHYPRSFSFGEGVIVTSGFIYSYWASFHNIIQSKFSEVHSASDPVLITLAIQLGFLLTILICRGILLFMKPHTVFALQELFTMCTKAAFANFLGKLQNTYEDFLFLLNWIVGYLILDARHLAFIFLWVTFLVATMVFVMNTVGQETTTVHRKFFHILMCLVYFPAILNDLNFIYMCSCIVLFVLVIIEAIRVLRFEILGHPIGAFINAGVANFRDARDSGPLLLTPIYLLVGCSAPIWLTGLYLGNTTMTNANRTPEELAAAMTGILSVGIGDTVASVVGSMYGHMHWPGSRKTIEGTLSSIGAQLFVVSCLCMSGYMPYTTVSLIALCISSVVNAVVEALTTQIDNLVVPLVAFNTFHLVMYLSDYFVA